MVSGFVCAVCMMTAGQGISPPSTRDRGLVEIFINSDCPIARSYSPEIRRITQKYRGQFEFLVVFCDNSGTQKSAESHLKDYDLPVGYRLDPKHLWAKKREVSAVPSVVVLDKKLRVKYVGRIDNLYASLGKRRVVATQFDLRNAIDAVIAGRPVRVPRTEVIGCAL